MRRPAEASRPPSSAPARPGPEPARPPSEHRPPSLVRRPPSLRASGAFLVVALACLAAALTPLLSARAAGLTVAMLAPIGVLGLVIAHLAHDHRRLLPSLGVQFAIAVSIALGLVLVALITAVRLMFLSTHDATIAIASTVLAAVVGARAAQVLVRGARQDVAALQDGLDRVGAGERDVVLRTGSDDELAALARSGNRMIEALAAEERARDASEQARRDVIGAVSHDLRTPLTALQLLVEAIDDGIVDPVTAREYLGAMRTHVNTLGGLINDLFELSRLEAGAFEWTTEQVHLADLVEETVAAMRPEASAKGVQVIDRLPDDLGLARANPEKLQRVLLNLLQNAIRHTPADGSVVVLAETGPDALEIEVRDSGSGIAAADRERVFEPFYRGGTEAARTRSGAGLGLAIARAIVEAHGGRIWLADPLPPAADEPPGAAAAGAGTRVRFSVPLAG